MEGHCQKITAAAPLTEGASEGQTLRKKSKGTPYRLGCTASSIFVHIHYLQHIRTAITTDLHSCPLFLRF